MGVSPSAFRKWLRGEAEPSRERLVALADVAKVGVAWLAKGEEPAPSFDKPVNGNGAVAEHGALANGMDAFVLLPRKPEAAMAGAGKAASPPIPDRGFLALRNDWVRHFLNRDPSHIALEQAVGESMQPTIHEGDLLLVDTTERDFGEYGIYVLTVGEDRMVKRVQRKLDGSLRLISDNPSYEPDLIPAAEAKSISGFGRVVWIGRKV